MAYPSYPCWEKFVATQLSAEEKEKYDSLRVYQTPRLTNNDACYEIYQEKIDKAAPIKKKLAVVIAQEKPKSTESEERTVNYWRQQLADYKQSEGISEQYLLDQLTAIEQNYLAKKAVIESRLEQCRGNKVQKESFFTTRLQNAQQLLDDRRNYKSAARIRLEMELQEPQSFIDAYNKELHGVDKWKELYTDLKQRFIVWKTEEDAKPLPPSQLPRVQKKVMKFARRSASDLGTPAASSAPAEHSSEIASERATTEHSAPDQQTSPP